MPASSRPVHLTTYVADLHIHSCLSPCGRDEMAPRAIVQAALGRGLDLIAITDHNTARMCPVVGQLARDAGLAFLYGLELQTREDVHLLAYFDDEDRCMAFSEDVYRLLPNSEEDLYGLGTQMETDISGRAIRRERRFLVQGLEIGFRETVEWIRTCGGLPVPAHVDREMFSVHSQLGRFPDGVSFSMVEVIGETLPAFCEDASILRTSDAHDLDQIARRATSFRLAAPTVAELRLAAASMHGRRMQGTLERAPTCCDSIEM
jgi:3',5'-nucleoside bisphosphate phosphatase